MFILNDLTCGGLDFTFSNTIPHITSLAITIIMIAVPVLLVIFGMIDMGKAITAQKEDEIKKGQQTLIKRIVAAAIVFFVIIMVKLLLSIVAPGTGADAERNNSIVGCFDCFVNGPKKCEDK